MTHKHPKTVLPLLPEAIERAVTDILDDVEHRGRLAAVMRADHGDALNVVGTVLAQRGELEKAIAVLEQARSLDPQNPEILNNLGLALYNRGAYHEAVNHFEFAIRIRPDYGRAGSNLGLALVSLNRFEAAIDVFRKVVRNDEGDFLARYNLGVALLAVDQHAESVKEFKKALDLRPDASDARLGLARSLSKIRRHAKAVEHYRILLLEDEYNAGIMVELARELLEGSLYEEAHFYLTRALSLAPELPSAYAVMGGLQQELGNIEDAKKNFELALKLDPNCMRYLAALSQVIDAKTDDTALRLLEKQHNRIEDLSDSDKVDLYFSLGKLNNDLDNEPNAFFYVLKANLIKRKLVKYNEQAALAADRDVERRFSKKVVTQIHTRRLNSIRPVFIVGFPRSGSTLVEQIIGSHQNISGAGEVSTLYDVLLAASRHLKSPVVNRPLNELTDDLRTEIADKYMDKLEYHASISRHRCKPMLLSNKTLGNYVFIGVIKQLFPDGIIINSVRDPIDTCLSCFSRHFSSLDYTYDLGELGRRYFSYQRIMSHWRDVLPQGSIIDVKYEYLVKNIEVVAKSLIKSCGVPWSDSCLEFYKSARPVKTASLVQVRQPIYTRSVGRWKPDPEVLEPLLAGLRGDNVPN